MAKIQETVEKDPSRPHYGVLSQFIDRQIDVTGKKASEIAKTCSFSTPNMVSMIRKGFSKLPTKMVGKMAQALEVDAAFLYRLMMQEYDPEGLQIIEQIFGRAVGGGALDEAVAILRSSKIAGQASLTAEQQSALKEFALTL